MDLNTLPSSTQEERNAHEKRSLADLLDEALRSPASRAPLPSSTPHWCHLCGHTTVIFELSKESDIYWFTSFSSLPYESGYVLFPLLEVSRKAQAGCDLFHWILSRVDRGLETPEAELLRHLDSGEIKLMVSLSSYYKSTLVPSSSDGTMQRRVLSEWDRAEVIHRYQRARSPFRAQIDVELSVSKEVIVSARDEVCLLDHNTDITPRDHSMPSLANVRLTQWNKDSTQSFAFAKRNLQICQTIHTDCQPSDKGRPGPTQDVPSRLLRFEATMSPIVRLEETSHHHITTAYAALSYCWGGLQQTCLSTVNHAALCEGIRFDALTKTTQDAIRVCRALGILYLWVDALCIIQDDETDKQREISRMAAYYSNSLVTLCAASASGAGQGFLSYNYDSVYDLRPTILTFEDLYLREEVNQITLACNRILVERRKTAYQMFRSANIQGPREPLAERAWTFQEALLSPRVLIYASDQVYWCCRGTYTGCGGPSSLQRKVTVRQKCTQHSPCRCEASLIRDIDDLPQGIFNLAQRSSMSTSAQWDMIVEDFSARLLSVESDKLRACAAISSHFNTIFRARWPDVLYAAGLWFSAEHPASFFRQLLWKSTDSDSACRPKTYRAPSWSWASIDGGVSNYDRKEFLLQGPSALKITSLRIEPSSELAPFAEIENAVLTVNGRLLNVNLARPEAAATDLKIVLDTNEDRTLYQTGEDLYMLEIVPFCTTGDSPAGLLLTQIGRKDGHVPSQYKRIGSFACSKKSDFARECFEDAKPGIYEIR